MDNPISEFVQNGAELIFKDLPSSKVASFNVKVRTIMYSPLPKRDMILFVTRAIPSPSDSLLIRMIVANQIKINPCAPVALRIGVATYVYRSFTY